MKLKNLNKLIHVVSLLLIVVGLLGFAKLNSRTNIVQGQSDNVCPEGNGWIKYDSWSDAKQSQTHDAGTGNIISSVCVKGGEIKEIFIEDGIKSCWQVVGIGSQIASVSETWENEEDPELTPIPSVTPKDSNCKDISHASFLVITDPGLTPTPSVTPSVTLTPSPTPTNTPSPTDEPKPTDEPEDEKDDEDEDEDEDEEEKSEEVAVGGIVTPSGMILGAYANTGVTEDILMTLLGLSGSGMAAVGYLLHDKKKKK